MVLIISLVVGVIMGLLASRKGYMFVAWFFAGGIIGLVALSTLPNTKEATLAPETKTAMIKKGNIIGGVLSALSIGLGVILAFAAQSTH